MGVARSVTSVRHSLAPKWRRVPLWIRETFESGRFPPSMVQASQNELSTPESIRKPEALHCRIGVLFFNCKRLYCKPIVVEF